MKAIKPYTQIFNDFNGQDALKKIEACGRVCYKSEGKIEEDSAEKFVAGLIKRGHEAMLEHASFIFELPRWLYNDIVWWINELETKGDFTSFLRFTNDSRFIISGNVRAWRSLFKVCDCVVSKLPKIFEKFVKENPILFPEFQNIPFEGTNEHIKQLKVADLVTENEKLTHWDVTVKFVVDRGISHELVRHRLASFAQESTRYCNYAQDKFGKEITYIIPNCLNYKSEAWNVWKEAMKACEDAYFKLLDIGLLPQEARAVLPNSLKTEVVMTSNLAEWHHFFNLRAANKTGKAHPQMLEVTRPLLDDLKELIPVVFDDITCENGGD